MKTSLKVFATLTLALLFGQSAHADLVAYYAFDDASSSDVAVDTSGNGNDGDVYEAEYTADGGGHTGAAGDRAIDMGTYNNGAYVDLITAADGAFESLTDNDQFTISLWINGSDEQPQPQWAFWAGPGRQIGSHAPWSDGTIYFDVAGCCTANQRISINEPDPSKYMGEWNHYVFLKDESFTAIYQNGEPLIDSGANAINPISDLTEFYIGSGPADDHRSYSGLIDDFAIFNTALSDEDIQKLYDGTYFGGGGTPGDFDSNGALDAADIDALSAEVRAGTNAKKYDVNADNLVTLADREVWVNTLRKTFFGDSNLDGEFNSSDFVLVFTAGQYEDATPKNASWATGDWDGDADFTSSDFVVAFQSGGYEIGPRAAVNAVPEPSSCVLLLGGCALLGLRRRK